MSNNFCGKCGSRLPENSNFCLNCGTKVPEKVMEDVSPVSYAMTPAHTTEANGAPEYLQREPESGGGKSGQPEKIVVEIPKVDIPNFPPLASSPTFILVLVDVALFLLVTFAPWIGSRYFGGALSYSLPKLVIEGFSNLDKLSGTSSLAYSSGMGAAYKDVWSALFLLALVTGIGWLVSAISLYTDVKHDYKGEQTKGDGAIAVAVLALITLIIAAFCMSYINSSLQNDYLDFGAIVGNVINVTSWVYVSLAGGVAAYLYRKSVYKGLGWID